MKEKIIKTKKHCPKTFERAFGAREIAKEIWGELKVSDSFLYLYRRFGTPCLYTNDEYKIAYEYNFWYKGLYFMLHGHTPEFVYLDAYFPKKYLRLQIQRYHADVRPVFERAYKDGVLCYPWNCGFSQIGTSLTKEQHKRYSDMFDKEAMAFFSKEDYKWLCDYCDRKEEDVTPEENKKASDLMEPFYSSLFTKFKAWAGDDKEIRHLFWTHPDLRYLPEVEKIVKEFCKELLKYEPIRDCDINIRGWK